MLRQAGRISHCMFVQFPTAARDRASGSTDIMAGLDTAYAISRNTHRNVSIVECTKAREFDEPDAFAVSVSDEGEDQTVVLRYEGSRAEFATVENKADQTALIRAFLASQPDQTADWRAIVEHLAAKGISERTAERVRPDMRKAGQLVTAAGKGRWRYVMPVAEAA